MLAKTPTCWGEISSGEGGEGGGGGENPVSSPLLNLGCL